MEILSVNSKEFKEYGRVIKNVDFSALVEAMKKTPCPEGVVYEPSIAELEALDVAKEIANVTYGEMPIQIGYCNGHNCMLNALEYHRDSEINVAATDAVLMLGLMKDVEDDFTYDTSKVKAFLVPAGTAVDTKTPLWWLLLIPAALIAWQGAGAWIRAKRKRSFTQKDSSCTY